VKFLIDQCLSPELAELARQRGYIGSAHVSQRNRAAAKDWQLMPYILAGDWTFVTRNSRDFRGSPSKPGR
jgi:predicted nuclease of predicted toxin-antitoxin system